jgi:hypothetical protein
MVLLNSCEGKYGPFVPMPKEFKSYTVFPKESYWIYRDSASMLLDSINQYDTYSGRLGSDWNSYYEYEDWILYYNSSRQLNKSIQRRSSLSQFREGDHLKNFSYVLYEDVQQSGVYAFYAVYFDCDTLKSAFQYSDDVEVTYIKLLSNITIGSNVFTNVKVFEQSKLLPGSPTTLTHRVFIAPNVGIIRRELFNGEVWELQKYFINN